MHSIGVDIVETARIRHLLTRYEGKFQTRILGEAEISELQERNDKVAYLAGRFAAKEAVIKALVPFLKDRPKFQAIQILNRPGGEPYLEISEVLDNKLIGIRFLISISHEKKYAVAMVISMEDK